MENHSYCSKGLSLLEVILAISVMAVLLIISVNYYSTVRSEQRVNYFVNQMSHLATGVANYVNAHPGADLSQMIPTGSDTGPQLVSNHIVEQADIQSVWFPGTQNQYQISISQNANLGSGYGPCLRAEIIFTIPDAPAKTVIECPAVKQSVTPVECEIANKLVAALSLPALSNASYSSYASNVFFLPTANAPGKGTTMHVQFCIE